MKVIVDRPNINSPITAYRWRRFYITFSFINPFVGPVRVDRVKVIVIRSYVNSPITIYRWGRIYISSRFKTPILFPNPKWYNFNWIAISFAVIITYFDTIITIVTNRNFFD